MGLFGLASFTSENRTKEIGIRKANGATTLSVMRLLLTSYTKWLIIAFIIALPIAFMLGKIFLGRFYFHTPMPLWAFIAGPLHCLCCSIINSKFSNLECGKPEPGKSTQVRISRKYKRKFIMSGYV